MLVVIHLHIGCSTVFSRYLDKFVLVFLDGILVYSKNEEHLRLTLQFLREHQLYAKLSKCDFYKDIIQQLGHIILEEGISMDLDKIEAIKNCPTPNNVTEVRSFMGLARYYKRFIERLSKVAHAITYLQRKGIQFEWTSKCKESFQQLKYILTSAPVLNVADTEIFCGMYRCMRSRTWRSSYVRQ